MVSLSETFVVRESDDSVKFLHPGTEIELFDRSPGAGPEGRWLESRIHNRITYKDVRGKTIVGYEVNAPWTVGGTKDVAVDDFGRTWRLRKL